MLSFCEKISEYIDKVLQIALSVLAVTLVVVNLTQVAGRYLFFYSLPWSEELSVYMYAWLIFLALHALARNREELTIEVFTFKSVKSENIMGIFRDALVLITLVFILVASWQMIGFATRFPRSTAALWGISTTPLYYVMPFSFILVIFQKILSIFQRIRDIRNAKGV